MSDSELIKRSSRMRKYAIASIYEAKSGHPGGVLSAIDLINYFVCELNADSEKVGSNRFVLSKGHSAPALYAAAAELGWIPRSLLRTLRQLGSPLQGHPSVTHLPWVETSTGSLGQGFSVAIGMALGSKRLKRSFRVFCMLGDGELQEGEIWEGAMSAAHYKLDNLCAIIDYNKLQSDDSNENVMALEPLAKKWQAFNWNVIEIDGHDFEQIKNADKDARLKKGSPTVIISHTVKGRGVRFMESQPAWHGSVALRKDEFVRALSDLGADEEEIVNFTNGKIWLKKNNE